MLMLPMNSRLLLTLVAVAALSSAHGARAASGYAGEFLAVGVGARALALGGAYVALVDDATAGYWNPAALATGPDSQVHFMHAERYSGLVDQDFIAIVGGSRLMFDGVALSLLRLGVDGIEFTAVPDAAAPVGPDNRPVVSSTESAADYALYLSGGRRVGDRLDVGASAKIIYRNVADFTAYGLGLDLGARYRLAQGVTLAANLRDATTTPIFWDTDTTDRIRPSLALGVAFTSQMAGGQAVLAVGSRAGGNAEDDAGAAPLNAGIEYSTGRIALRAGFEEERQTYGLGLFLGDRMDLDVAYLQHDELEGTYLFSATVGF
jgi:hypothetical protein